MSLLPLQIRLGHCICNVIPKNVYDSVIPTESGTPFSVRAKKKFVWNDKFPVMTTNAMLMGIL